MLLLVVVGAVLTTVMQSSTASIAVTLSALYAGAVGLDQALALVIGQNIGTATSSAVAAIGASSTAKRLAVAYIAFKLVAALIAIVVFPFVTPLIVRASQEIDATGLLAAYHTAYNVVGVAVLLPLMGPFTRLIERLLPERGSPFAKYLDPAALRSPTVAVEAVRRTVERALETLCLATAKALDGAVEGGTVRPAIDDATLGQASDALRQAGDFLSRADPPPSEEGHAWYTSTVHALDHASRLAEAVGATTKAGLATDGPEELSAAVICARSMREAAGAAAGLARSAGPGHAAEDDLAKKSARRAGEGRARRQRRCGRKARGRRESAGRSQGGASPRHTRYCGVRKAHRKRGDRPRRCGRASEPPRTSRLAHGRPSRGGRRRAHGA